MKLMPATLLIVALFFQTGTIRAEQAQSVPVTASTYVTGACKFSSAELTLSFGSLDPSSTAPATAQISTSFWCTKGATATLSSNEGLHSDGKSKRMKHATASEYIPYSLTLQAPSLTGAGKSSALQLNIDGYIANSDYVNTLVGNYSDTVELRITP